MPPPKKNSPISQYLSKIGAKGGSKTGPSKARDPEKMKAASLKGHEAKRLKKLQKEDKDGENNNND